MSIGRSLAPVLLVLACHAHAAPLQDEDLAVAASLRDQALKGTAAYDFVDDLTREVGHRMAGTPNDAKGVAWTVARFKQLGFDRVYTMPVSFPVWDRGFESASIVSPEPQSLTATALGGSIGTPAGGISAEVVMFKDAAALQAAAPGSLQGKIAYVANRMERAKDGSGYGVAVIARVAGAVYAARAGAAAVLIRSVGTDSDSRSPHTGTMRYDNMLTRIPAAALGQVDADQLEAQLARGEAVTVKLELGSRVRNGTYTSANVIGEVLGREKPEEMVLIGGHLDSWDLGTGAIDNASGVAITATAAALIAALPERPRRSIRVVAFANEEQGIHGGRRYAREHADQVALHIGGAESDFGAGRIWRFSSRVKPEALPVVEQIHAVLAPLGIERGNNEAGGGADLSAMRDLGMPIFALGQDGTNYFDIHHTAKDTIAVVKAEDLDQNVAAYAALAYLLAQAGPIFGPLPVAATPAAR